MIHFHRAVFFAVLMVAMTAIMTVVTTAAEWSVPLAGNTFRTRQDTNLDLKANDNGVLISDSRDTHSAYVHFDRPCKLSIAINGNSKSNATPLALSINDTPHAIEIGPSGSDGFVVEDIEIAEAGYSRFDFQLNQPKKDASVVLKDMVITSSTPELKVDYVRDNEGNMFYWGRRGPSVHLGYPLPSDIDITHAYSEITVPVGQDPIGAYYMANGFAEGYFGIQVNSETERRVLFSVWSPFGTDDPSKIPEEDRVVTTAKGPGVSAQDFGNEGSGGQSFLVYPWRAGVTYRFLTEVQPDGKGNTVYTSWFEDKAAGEWLLIASFRRPKTDTYYQGFHSFLENFAPSYGQLPRQALYANQCVLDTAGKWHAITAARFTGDGTASDRHRLDFSGGVDGPAFFLKHCGFTNESTELGQTFPRPASVEMQPPSNLP